MNETRAATKPDAIAIEPVATAPTPTAAESLPERSIYAAGGGRRTFFAFAFLLLLPFFASLPVLLAQRVVHGLWYDTWNLLAIGIGFTIVMLLVCLELMFSLRARVVIGDTGVRVRLPPRLISLPMPLYRTHEIPYADIAAVETRREIYGGRIAPVLMRCAWVRTKDGKLISLGSASEADTDPCFPVPEIAGRIARRAGLEVTSTGNVHRRLRRRAGEGDGLPVSEEAVAALNQKHRRFMLGLVGGMLLLLAIGIVYDFATSSIDRGERSRDAVQRKK